MGRELDIAARAMPHHHPRKAAGREAFAAGVIATSQMLGLQAPLVGADAKEF